MSARSEGLDLFTAVEAAAKGVATTLGKDAVAVVLYTGAPPYGEVLKSHDVPPEVSEALISEGGREVADRVRLSGQPVRIMSEALPESARELRAALRRSRIAALALFPLFGETGVVGCLAVPYEKGEDAPDREHHGWRLACRSLEGLQLTAATAALRMALAEDRRRPAELFDGVLVLDSWERVALADGFFRSMAGWHRADPFGRSLDGLSGTAVLNDLADNMPGGLTWRECGLPGAHDTVIPVALSCSRIGPGDGALAGGRMIFLRDMRPEKGSPVDGTSRMLALGMRVAHAADRMSQAIRLAKAAQTDVAVSSSVVDRFEHEIADAALLVTETLERCLPEDEQKTLQLNGLLEEVLARYRPGLDGEQVRLFTFKREDLPLVPGDRLPLLRAVRILVHAALEALRPAGGTLTVRTWADDIWVYGAISDDGAGRDNAGEAYVEPLFPDDGQLNDTGLEEVREIVEQLGGRLMVESRPNVWTRVTMMLRQERRRAKRPDGGAERPIALSAKRPGGGLSVLVVDDNAALRSVLRRYLERRGHAVTEAIDGVEGLRIVRNQSFDRLIVDIQMPNKDGPEMFDELGDVAPAMRARTIFITGGFLTETAERFIKECGRPAVRKPFDLEEMARTVEA